MSRRILPLLIVHAEWSSNPKKRWVAIGQLLRTNYELYAPEPVGETATLLSRLQQRANGNDPIIVGFDFPIGLPSSYANHAGITQFLEILPEFGIGRWSSFFEIAAKPGEISV